VSASLPLSIIETAIKFVLNRNNYGLDSPADAGKLPAALCVWRWEVKEEHRDWLPKALREKTDGRLAERVQVRFLFDIKNETSMPSCFQAKKDLAAFFKTLSQEEQDAILDPKSTVRLPAKDTNKVVAASVSPAKTIDTESKDSPQPLKKQQKPKAEDAENDAVSA